ncbi:MAG: thiosulfate/3-mercaptopyruvate sulfurtransferase [Rhodobacteraceae bacterium HLUCCA12]|nr:MAG: thiosulfate/3-mercaptopyruvate sulfurtransferase [Rhodobacteraceae bacterium HLUCCA12]
MKRPIRLALTLSAALVPGLALAAPQGWSPLLEPSELATMLDDHGDDIRVVHVTGDFEQGHIPGAAFSPYTDWRSGGDNPGALRDVDHFQGLARDLGIDADTPVVVVHSGANPTDMGAAARVYWTLKSLGVQDLALLNGGFSSWTEADLPVSTQAASIPDSDFEANWDDSWRITTEEVAQLVEEGDSRLIDARPTDFFSGVQWSIAAPGTIRGSANLTYDSFFDGNRMQGADQIRALAEENGFTDSPLTVSFCNTGHWAAINWFALSELGEIENTRLYAESMAEYTAADLPLDNAPNRVTYYWRATMRWISDVL